MGITTTEEHNETVYCQNCAKLIVAPVHHGKPMKLKKFDTYRWVSTDKSDDKTIEFERCCEFPYIE